jgi:GDPmannose 4,6-dehydratase
VFAFDATRNYRESYAIFASNGIMFNHESPRRGETFVTRKITRAVARITAGQQECLYLGNLAPRRDWGFAADYVQAMWMMLQASEPDDYVIATGEAHTVREFCEMAFKLGGMPITWQGSGLAEVGIDDAGKTRVRIDPRYFRPAEVDTMLGDASYARQKLGWKPKVTFPELVRLMVEADSALVRGDCGPR